MASLIKSAFTNSKSNIETLNLHFLTKTMCGICSTLTIKALEQRQLRRSGDFIDKFG